MRSLKVVMIVLSMGVIALFVASPAVATIVNMTTGTTLFYDDFSGLGSNVSHAAALDASGDYDPVATKGVWAIYGEDGLGQQVQVTDNTGSPDPGPAPGTGSNYLRISRIAGIGGDAESQFTAQSTAGEHIRMNYWLNVSSAAVGAELQLYRDNGSLAGHIITNWAGFSVGVNTPSGPVNTGLTFAPGVWQKWQIDYTIGDPTFSLAIDGASKSGIPLMSAGGLGSILFSQDAHAAPGIPLYISEVTIPEPTSMGLLLSGLLGLLAYAWRKR